MAPRTYSLKVAAVQEPPIVAEDCVDNEYNKHKRTSSYKPKWNHVIGTKNASFM